LVTLFGEDFQRATRQCVSCNLCRGFCPVFPARVRSLGPRAEGGAGSPGYGISRGARSMLALRALRVTLSGQSAILAAGDACKGSLGRRAGTLGGRPSPFPSASGWAVGHEPRPAVQPLANVGDRPGCAGARRRPRSPRVLARFRAHPVPPAGGAESVGRRAWSGERGAKNDAARSTQYATRNTHLRTRNSKPETPRRLFRRLSYRFLRSDGGRGSCGRPGAE